MSFTVLENVPLFSHTTFKIGGPAKFFVTVKDVAQIKQAVGWAGTRKVKYLILGGGSNVLIPDKGFNGLVIKIGANTLAVKNTILTVEAGMPLAQVIAMSIQNNLTGLEWATGIPGTIGGAVRGNAGSFGGEMGNVVTHISVFDGHKIFIMKNAEIRFGYRDSIFKHKKAFGGKIKYYVILAVTLELARGDRKKSLELVKQYASTKSTTQTMEYPSAGCVFKNYQLKKKDNALMEKHPELRDVAKNGIVSAGWLVDQCGLKGKKVGGALISNTHANFVVNVSKASAKDVLALMKIMKTEVKKKFGIMLEEEILVVKN